MTRRVKRGGAKKPRSSAKRSYRKRVKASKCRGGLAAVRPQVASIQWERSVHSAARARILAVR